MLRIAPVYSGQTLAAKNDCVARGSARRRRRGAATVWVILVVPLLLVSLGAVIEITHLWLARAELENSLEAAALAAVKEWGDANGVGGTAGPRNVGVQYAALNVINGLPVEIGPNLGSVALPANPNLNKLCDPQKSDMDFGTTAPDGNLVFGGISGVGTLVFDATEEPDCGGGQDFGVRAQASVEVKPIFAQFAGVNLGPFCVSAVVTARYDCASGHPELVRVAQANVICSPGNGADP